MPSHAPASNHFSRALKRARSATGRTQEDFDVVSSRTYVSTLERGGKSPTLQKVDALAHVLGLHPLTLLTLAYVDGSRGRSIEQVHALIQRELNFIRERERALDPK
ncbi:MAG: XRE family transcriptional regulator [Betaproteobacteria bacterium HGW-Betaproteobacteria-15]|nr:MAG: XRE family transcriptional regulator [Betaproteobacteria bacterium HGW-Betaproteobacteria-15]